MVAEVAGELNVEYLTYGDYGIQQHQVTRNHQYTCTCTNPE